MKPEEHTSKKNPAAVALGKLGGRAWAENHTAEERSEAARKAGLARSKKLSAEERRRIAMLGVKARRLQNKQKRSA